MARRPEGNHEAYTRSGLLTKNKKTGLNINNCNMDLRQLT